MEVNNLLELRKMEQKAKKKGRWVKAVCAGRKVKGGKENDETKRKVVAYKCRAVCSFKKNSLELSVHL